VYKEWDNGNKTVYLGFDPLALNSAPTYVWWGATMEGPSYQALDWFIGGCPNALGNVNEDPLDAIDILDIVMTVGIILGTVTDYTECAAYAADANQDGSIDILDIVLIVSWILNPRADEATTASLIQTDHGLKLLANGYVGGIQMDIVHGDDFSLVLSSDMYFGDYVTNGNTTTVLVVGPGSEIFTATGDYTIENVVAATTNGYIEVGVNAPVEFDLGQAYPNPFNPTTQLSLNLPADAYAVVKVYNVVGQVVATLVDGNMEAGYHNITWNASNVPSGMYMIRAEAGADVSTQKVMLLK
jgi:hypothetical protein